MALQVTITGDLTIARDEETVLTASVIDTDTGLTPTETVSYAWSATDGSFVGAVDGVSATFLADIAGTAATTVEISCAASLPAGPASVTSATLTSLSELGIGDVIVNLLFAKNSSAEPLRVADTPAAGSDDIITAGLRVDRIRWLFTGGRLTVNRGSDSTIAQSVFWNVERDNYSVYFVAPDGDVYEIPPAWYGAAGGGFVRWTVPTGDDRTAFNLFINNITDGEDMVMGIGTPDSIGSIGESETGSATVSIASDGPTPLSFGVETIAAQAWVVGTAVNLTLPVATGGIGAKTYSLSPATPGGIHFTAATRVLSGTPTGRFTSATFRYIATDADSNMVELTFTIVVTATAISFDATVANQSWTVGTSVSLTLPTGSGGVGDLTPSLSGTLPAGVTFTVGTRVLAGTPTEAFTSATLTYTLTDEEDESASITFTILVSVAVALSIETLDVQALTLGTDYNIEIEVLGDPDKVTAEGDWERWYYTWDAANSLLTLSGNADSNGTWEIMAVKGMQTVEEDIDFTAAPPAPVITAPVNLIITRGVDYNENPIPILIANNPSTVRMRGLLVGLGFDKTETGANIVGISPIDAVLTVTEGSLEIFASTAGGEDTVTVPFTIN